MGGSPISVGASMATAHAHNTGSSIETLPYPNIRPGEDFKGYPAAK
jgi:hypothetical protein